MLIKILTFNVCVHLHWWFGGGGVDVGGFINRAVAVIELFFLSILNLKLLKQNKYSRATTVSYVFQNYCLCNAPSHPPTCTNEK